MRSIDERKRAEQALCARALQQKAVARLGWEALTGAGATPLMQAAVQAVASTLDVPLVKILEVRPGGDLVLGAGVGWREGADHRVRADEPSQAAYTLARHEPVIVEDLATETRFHGPKLLFDHGAVSGVSVVIAGRHGPFGILGAHTKAWRAFSQDDVSFVQAVANVVGEAIARRHAEEDLAESEQRFRQLADNVGEVFYVSAVQPPRVLYVSPAYEAVWGHACRSVRDDPASWLAAVHPDDRAAVEGCAWQSHDVEYRIVRPDGTERWIHDRASRVRGGSEERVVGIAEDVTTHKQAEERACRLATAEASVRARDEVLSVVAHDLRNPLHSIAMAAALLRQPQLDADRRARHAQAIARSVNVADRLVADLLDVSRIEAGQLVIEPEPIDPAAVLREVEDVFQLTARDKGLVLEVEAAGALPYIAADRDRIVQVIGNLVGNAVKFTPPGGRIRVQATARRDGVEIAVADTGPGIPREAVPHVFDRFWRARPAERRGLGLGLAIVRGIVQAHGGRVWAESELGAGSTFCFTMPLAATDGAGASTDGMGRPAP